MPSYDYRFTLEKFTSIDGGDSYTFPRYEFESEHDQDFRNSYQEIVGADYAFDDWGVGLSPVKIASEIARFHLVNTTIALINSDLGTLRAVFRKIGLGKLWRVENAATERWAYARAQSPIALKLMRTNRLVLPVIAPFDRLSDWFNSSLTTVIKTVTASPTDWTVNNPGNLKVKAVVVRFRANGAAGFVNPKLYNVTNGYTIETTRDSASANSEVRVDTSRPAIEYSNDDGASYANDFANYVLPSLQAPLTFLLEPGDNTIRYTGGGTPALDVEIAFYPAYA